MKFCDQFSISEKGHSVPDTNIVDMKLFSNSYNNNTCIIPCIFFRLSADRCEYSVLKHKIIREFLRIMIMKKKRKNQQLTKQLSLIASRSLRGMKSFKEETWSEEESYISQIFRSSCNIDQIVMLFAGWIWNCIRQR